MLCPSPPGASPTFIQLTRSSPNHAKIPALGPAVAGCVRRSNISLGWTPPALLLPPPGLEPGSLGKEPSILSSQTMAEPKCAIAAPIPNPSRRVGLIKSLARGPAQPPACHPAGAGSFLLAAKTVRFCTGFWLPLGARLARVGFSRRPRQLPGRLGAAVFSATNCFHWLV